MKIVKYMLLGCLAIGIIGCSTIAVHDQYAYTQAVNLKVDAQSIVGKGDKDYTTQEQGVNELMLNVEKAYEYEKGREKNAITTKMWEILLNPESDLLGGFIKRWKDEGKLNKAYVLEKQKQIGEAFDQIIGLESGKIKKSEVSR